jgi:hypothetical protein
MKPAKFGITFYLFLVQENEITTAQDSAESDASAKETNVARWGMGQQISRSSSNEPPINRQIDLQAHSQAAGLTV